MMDETSPNNILDTLGPGQKEAFSKTRDTLLAFLKKTQKAEDVSEANLIALMKRSGISEPVARALVELIIL